MLKDRVTIYVPTYNRQAFLKRVLDFYVDSGFQVLVSDDTKTPFAEADDYPNLTYCQSGLPFSQSLAEPGLEHISTPYMVMCADDILISQAAIAECVEFLDAHPDYAAAQGYQSSMYFSDDGYDLRMEEAVSPDFSAERPSDRLLKFFSSPHRLYWSVWRSDAWKGVYSNVPLSVLNEPRGINCESMIYFATAMVGKLRRLPIFFSLHEDVPSIEAKKRRGGFTHWEYATSPQHKESFDIFVEEAATLLQKFEDLDREEAVTYARRAFEINGLPQRNEVGRKTLAYRIRRELRSVWRKTFGKRSYQDRKKAEKEAFKTMNDGLMAAMRPQCRAEMERMAEFVYNYPRCKASSE
jgi:glycosyltransferase domain-containing protein